MDSLQHRIVHTQRLLQPVEEFDRLVVGDDPEAGIQIARQRLAHVYDGTALPSWTWLDVVIVGTILFSFWGSILGVMYLLTPFIVKVME